MSMRSQASTTVTVRYFASLREALGRGEESIALEASTTVGALWRQVAGERLTGVRVLAAVNAEYADFTAAVAPGDEVAFFPPVTGG